LVRLLRHLGVQTTNDRFTYSVIVADNDRNESARQAVAEYSSKSRIHISYCVEPVQNIALVRNRALQHAEGDLIAFIDDDEYPTDTWLFTLFAAYKSYGADGVLGPVKPVFECEPPKWVRDGAIFERLDHETGYQLSWAQCRTGNVLFRRNILEGVTSPFRPEFGTAGEDMDFFRRMINRGFKFIWCSDAVVYETVSPARWSRGFLIRRALLRGSNFPKHRSDRAKNILRSIIAVPAYTLALPVLSLFGQHMFLKYLIKLCDHVSRLLAFAGWSVVKVRETS